MEVELLKKSESNNLVINTDSRISTPKRYHLDENSPYEECEVFSAMKRNGLYIANPSGIVTQDRLIDPRDIVGIAEYIPGRKDLSKSLGGWLYRNFVGYDGKFFHIGTLWIDYSSAGASRKNKWILESFGKGNFEKLDPVISPVANYFKVALENRIVSQNSKPTFRLAMDDCWP